KLAGDRAAEAHGQKDRADDDMATVEARRHEKCRAVNRLEVADACSERGVRRIRQRREREMIEAEGEGRVAVLVSLHAAEGEAEQNGQQQSLHRAFAIADLNGVMR